MDLKIDPAAHVTAAERSVAFLQRDGQPAATITLTRTLATSREDLWDALTNADRIPRWFLPISGDLRPGGTYQLEGNAGGTITACDPPSRLDITWEFGGDTSWVEVRCEDTPDGHARLTLAHTHILSDQWDTFGPGATGVGWDGALLGLALHFGSPGEAISDPTGFALSGEGQAFYRGASEAWGQAAIAAGTDPATASAAARQTAAFYTGEAAPES